MKILKNLMLISLILILLLFLININVQGANGGNNSDLQLMARAINGEARGESYEGQVAVGAVILNRVKDSRFPNTIARSNISARSIYSSFRRTN